MLALSRVGKESKREELRTRVRWKGGGGREGETKCLCSFARRRDLLYRETVRVGQMGRAQRDERKGETREGEESPEKDGKRTGRGQCV